MTSTRSIPMIPPVVFLCRGAIGFTGVAWLYEGYGLEFGVALGALVLTLLPAILIHDRQLRDAVAAVTSVLLAAHVVLGMQGALYDTSSVYDKAMHVLGSGAIAALLTLAIRRYCMRHLIELPMVIVAAIVLAGTLSAGTLWEVFEFAMDRTGLFYAQRGLFDTMLDLIADAGGALLMIVVLVVANFISINQKRLAGWGGSV